MRTEQAYLWTCDVQADELIAGAVCDHSNLHQRIAGAGFGADLPGEVGRIHGVPRRQIIRGLEADRHTHHPRGLTVIDREVVRSRRGRRIDANGRQSGAVGGAHGRGWIDVGEVFQQIRDAIIHGRVGGHGAGGVDRCPLGERPG